MQEVASPQVERPLEVPRSRAAIVDGEVCHREAGDVPDALGADDAFHGIFVAGAGNRFLSETIERLTPLVRRLEQLRFASLPGRRSVRAHQSIIQAASAGDQDRAVRLAKENWSTLGDEIDRPVTTIGASHPAPTKSPGPRKRHAARVEAS